MNAPSARARAAIAVVVAILAAAAIVAAALVARHGPPAATACAGSPTKHAVIQIQGQRTTADLSVSLRDGQVCASVHGPTQAVVGVQLQACTYAAGPDLPGLCTSTANTLNGHLALHQTGRSTITIPAPTDGYVIALGSLGTPAGTASASITLTIGPDPTQTPTADRSHPATPLPPHRGAPGPQPSVTHQTPTTAAA